jgi:septal ring factor EnvC (AmiA/AmiB activator)
MFESPLAMTRRLSAGLAGAAALAGALALAAPCRAEPPAPGAAPAKATTDPGGVDAERKDLDAKRSALGQSKAAQQKITADIAALTSERAKLADELVSSAAKVRDMESRIAAQEQRLAELDARQRGLTASLDTRRATIARLLGGLEQLGRNPPPALLVQPEDALKSVRSAMLLGAVLPQVHDEATALAGDLEALRKVRRAVSVERDKLETGRADLTAAHKRLSTLISARQDTLGQRRAALSAEQKHAAALAGQIADLKELITRMDAALDARRTAAAAAGRTAPDAAAAAAKLGPVVAFADEHGHLPQPVNGEKIKMFGDPDGFGGAQKGVSISTHSGAIVTSPCDGWVVYAGPFRSYGQLLILNAGGGYHVLLAGMKKLSVALGQFVLTGEPVAEMGDGGSRLAAATNAGVKQPVLYVEFRKDGTAVDPGPWWASNASEKVRG